MPPKKAVLGPLQPIWDAWNSQADFVDGIPNIYFENVIRIQFNEIEDHVAAGQNGVKINNEIVDIMSICMNWLRSRGLNDQAVADAITARSPRFDDTAGIIQKYNELYGL